MDVIQKAIQSTIINAISLAFFDAGICIKDAIIACSAGFLHQFQKEAVIGNIKRFELFRRKQFKRIVSNGLFTLDKKDYIYRDQQYQTINRRTNFINGLMCLKNTINLSKIQKFFDKQLF